MYISFPPFNLPKVKNFRRSIRNEWIPFFLSFPRLRRRTIFIKIKKKGREKDKKFQRLINPGIKVAREAPPLPFSCNEGCWWGGWQVVLANRLSAEDPQVGVTRRLWPTFPHEYVSGTRRAARACAHFDRRYPPATAIYRGWTARQNI